jgi:hypothetical protein
MLWEIVSKKWKKKMRQFDVMKELKVAKIKNV